MIQRFGLRHAVHHGAHRRMNVMTSLIGTMRPISATTGGVCGGRLSRTAP
jgi:hypothetical protein